MTRKVCFPFAGDSVGGSHISTLILIDHIRARGYSPLVVLHREGPLADHLRSRSIPYELLSVDRLAGARAGFTNWAQDVAGVFGPIRRYLVGKEIEIVHGNDIRINMSWLLPARAAGAAFVWHQRTLPNSRSMIWSVLPCIASAVIPISKGVARAMRLSDGNVIYNPFLPDADPVSRDECRRAACARHAIPPNALVLGFVGRLVGYKRPDICIRVLAHLKEHTIRPVHCVFLGLGVEQEITKIRDLAASLGVGDRIHFAGFCFPIEPELKGLDILLAPSETEGFGRSLVESIFVGTPFIASDIEAHREIVEVAGIGKLAKAGDAESFAEEVAEFAARPPGEIGLSNNCAGTASTAFSSQAHADHVLKIYDGLSGRPS